MINLEQYTSDWETVSLQDLDAVSLLKRVDTKYVISIRQLEKLLQKVKGEYKILEIDGKRNFKYHTTYFDTPDFDFFLDHHNGLFRRTKVRFRKYVDSDLVFYEVKRKMPSDVTEKTRERVVDIQNQITSEQYKMVDKDRTRNKKLDVKVSNIFNRMTLTQPGLNERVTIDTQLNFFTDDDEITIPEIAIVEVKQPRFNFDSPIVKALREIRQFPESFSKYVMSVVLLELHEKYNRFKPQLLLIDKMRND